MSKKIPWIIFDADNTLWDVESIYDHFRKEFALYIKRALDLEESLENIEEHQKEIDKLLSTSHGYAASRFPRSFQETTLFYLNNKSINFLTEEESKIIRKVRELGEAVFNTRACNFKDAAEALREGKEKGYDIAIYTSGEHWVQDRRLKQSGLLGLCDTTDIQHEKTIKTLRDFCDRKKVDIGRSFVIGDSLKSDIYPASEIGLSAIHIPNRNWSKKEKIDISEYAEASTLTTAVSQIPCIKIDKKSKIYRNKVRLILEGGGAKGIAHIGGLKALEESGFEVEVIAGSSAGAIIAGLCAAGYNADSILQLIPNKKISSDSSLKKEPNDVIGKDNWKSIKNFLFVRKMISNCNSVLRISLVVSLGLGAFLFLCQFVQWYIIIIALALLTFPISLNMWRVFRKFGLASLDDFTEWYDKLLRDSPLFRDKLYNNEKIKFRDFYNIGAESPVIVASDILNQKIRTLTFCDCSQCTRLTTQQRSEIGKINDMSVADAVAASAALPVIFEPRKYEIGAESALLVDGGLLSNLPAWSLAEDREKPENRTPIVAFELLDYKRTDRGKNQNKRHIDSFSKYLSRIFSTSISGVRSLETRDIEGLHVIPIETNIGVTEFDMSEDHKNQTFKKGRNVVRHKLTDVKSEIAWNLVNEDQIRPALKVAHEQCLCALRSHAHAELVNLMPFKSGRKDNPVEFPHLRVNIMLLNSLGKLRIVYKYGMDGDADDDLVLDKNSGAAGIALRKRRAVVADMQEAQLRFSEYYQMTKYQQAMVRPTLKALISVPMLPRVPREDGVPPVRAVVNFDSDDLLVDAFKERNVLEEFYQIAAELLEAWETFARKSQVPTSYEEKAL